MKYLVLDYLLKASTNRLKSEFKDVANVGLIQWTNTSAMHKIKTFLSGWIDTIDEHIILKHNRTFLSGWFDAIDEHSSLKHD